MTLENHPNNGGPADIAQQARLWFIRLREEAVTPEDISEWEAWLRANPAHGEAYDAVAAVWTAAETVAVPRATAAELRGDAYDGAVPVAQWLFRKPRRRTGMWLAGLAAAASIAVMVSTQIPPSGLAETTQIATTRAQHKDAVLPDGSKVALGGMTTLRFTFARDRRTIEMQNGEALFNVVHERSRPFVVKTALGDITAVGTAFDVNVGRSAVVLSVSEGVVAFDPAATHSATAMKVSAGQRLVIDADGARLMQVEAGRPPSWTEGRLEYRSQALALVLDDINRYADAPVRLADPALSSLAYTGTVRLATIGQWAAGLGDVFPLTAEKAADGSILLKQKKASP
jgi:transmembrane sensor